MLGIQAQRFIDNGLGPRELCVDRYAFCVLYTNHRSDLFVAGTGGDVERQYMSSISLIFDQSREGFMDTMQRSYDAGEHGPTRSTRISGTAVHSAARYCRDRGCTQGASHTG